MVPLVVFVIVFFAAYVGMLEMASKNQPLGRGKPLLSAVIIGLLAALAAATM